jgi:hypothetical protein
MTIASTIIKLSKMKKTHEKFGFKKTCRLWGEIEKETR